MSRDDAGIEAALGGLGIEEPGGFLLRLEIERYLDALEVRRQLAPARRERLSLLLRAAHSAPGPISPAITDVYPEPPTPDGIRPATAGAENADADLDAATLSLAEGESLLKFQRRALPAEANGGHFTLGSVLLASDQIRRAELETALHAQLASGRRLGEELIEAGFATPPQIERGLLLQNRLVALTLAAAAALAPLTGAVKMVQAGQGRAALPVSATVVANARVVHELQPTGITLTRADLARGFAEFPAASRFSVVTNSHLGYVIEVHPLIGIFQSVQIAGLSSPVELGADGGSIYQRGPPLTGQTRTLSYRFVLRPETVAGTYAWPLQLEVRALD